MKHYFYNYKFLFVGLCVMLFSCTNEDGIDNETEELVPVSLGIEGIKTRAGDDYFNLLDRIGVYIVSQENTNPVDLLPMGNYVDNMGFTHIEEDDIWQADEPVYYPSNGSLIDLYAYYPFSETVFNEESTIIPFVVKTDQTDYEDYTHSDLAIASTFNVRRSTQKVHLTFDHKLSQLVFALKAGTGFSASDLMNAKLTIKNAIIDATFDLSQGNPGLPISGTQKADVLPNGVWEANESDNSLISGKKAIIAPQEINTQTYIEIKIGARTFTKKFSEPVVMKSGESRTFTITLNSNNQELEISTTLNPWNYGEPIEGDATEEEEDNNGNEDDGGILTDLEGNTYTYRKFGDAGYWMTQNLRSTTNGEISLVENGFADYYMAAYYYPGRDKNILETYPEYGLLYTLYAATGGIFTDELEPSERGMTKSNIQGICPEGWVIPSDYDWDLLEREIATNTSQYSSSENGIWDESWSSFIGGRGTHGIAMKSTTPVSSTYYYKGTSFEALPGSGGFDVLLVGSLKLGDVSGSYGGYARFWSSSAYQDGLFGFSREFFIQGYDCLRYNESNKSHYSIRCKKAE